MRLAPNAPSNASHFLRFFGGGRTPGYRWAVFLTADLAFFAFLAFFAISRFPGRLSKDPSPPRHMLALWTILMCVESNEVPEQALNERNPQSVQALDFRVASYRV